ncbi:DUF1707 and DUF4190 domain-containing protein [Streptomyces sp. NBC_00566]|uniref:DUF1707 and DUF4190 domain-containing protein n=1 Tax=Streptomyces sp. NBC_00566 TaxID=2975778 RepID=UPI003FCC380A
MSHPSWQPSWPDNNDPAAAGTPPVPPRPQGWPLAPFTGPFRPQSPAPWPGPPQAQGSAASFMLASHADRERAADVLRAGFAEGRLEKDEFDRRVGRVYAARTVGELALVVADLPQGPVPHPAPVAPVPQVFLPTPRPAANGKAVGAAVCGLLCVLTAGLTGIPAVVLGHTARAEIRRTGEDGDGLALTGLVLGWLSVGGWALLWLLLIAVGVLDR